MAKAETIVAVILALFGAGVSAGQGFTINRWVIGFWSAAVLVTMYSILAHHEPAPDVSILDLEVPADRPRENHTKEWSKIAKRFEALEGAAIRASHRLHDPHTVVRAERPDDADAPLAGWHIRSSDQQC